MRAHTERSIQMRLSGNAAPVTSTSGSKNLNDTPSPPQQRRTPRSTVTPSGSAKGEKAVLGQLKKSSVEQDDAIQAATFLARQRARQWRATHKKEEKPSRPLSTPGRTGRRPSSAPIKRLKVPLPQASPSSDASTAESQKVDATSEQNGVPLSARMALSAAAKSRTEVTLRSGIKSLSEARLKIKGMAAKLAEERKAKVDLAKVKKSNV